MADLYDGVTSTIESGVGKIPAHALASSLRELARGALTKAQIVSALSLDATQEANIDSIIALYQGLSTDIEKKDFLVKIHDVFILSEGGYYTKAKAKSELGF